MLVLHRKRKKINALTILVVLVILVAFWLALQIAVEHFFSGSVYLEFILLCILGFGFLGISYLLKLA